MTDRILLVLTGGTIGSALSNGSIGLDEDAAELLLAGMSPRLTGGRSILEIIEPITILSENATLDDWSYTCRAISDQLLQKDYIGVVVTHGTDTLASAAKVFALLMPIDIPIVLTGADLPLDDPRTNGFENFNNAIAFIRNFPERGTFVCYTNPSGEALVHRGALIRESRALEHGYLSVEDRCYGRFEGGRLMRFDEDLRPLTKGPGVANVLSLSDGVLLVEPHPGLRYDRYKLDSVAAVVHGVYHSGTVNATDGLFGFKLFAECCASANIPVFCGPTAPVDSPYDSSVVFRDSKVIVVPRMLTDSLYIKVALGIAAGLAGVRLREFVTEANIAHEILS